MRTIIVVLFVFFCYQCHGQRVTQRLQNQLVCTTIEDFKKMSTGRHELIISPKFGNTGSNRRLLQLCLKEKGISLAEDSNRIYSLEAQEFDLSSCNLSKVRTINDTSVMDSLAYIYWISVIDTVSLVFEMDTSLKSKRLDSLNFTAMYIGSPRYYKNYAVISIVIADSEACFLYELKKKRWMKVKNIYDPR